MNEPRIDWDTPIGISQKNVKSRLGLLGLQVPQVHGGVEFYR
jgi:hypothetical protein